MESRVVLSASPTSTKLQPVTQRLAASLHPLARPERRGVHGRTLPRSGLAREVHQRGRVVLGASPPTLGVLGMARDDIVHWMQAHVGVAKQSRAAIREARDDALVAAVIRAHLASRNWAHDRLVEARQIQWGQHHDTALQDVWTPVGCRHPIIDAQADVRA